MRSIRQSWTNGTKIENYLTAPSGFNPAWARDVLHATLAPYWVFWEKTEALGLDPANEPGAYGIDWSENVAVNKE